jgi:hypothetical protein
VAVLPEALGRCHLEVRQMLSKRQQLGSQLSTTGAKKFLVSASTLATNL